MNRDDNGSHCHVQKTVAEGSLVDERSLPSLRELMGGLLSTAETADFAVGKMRLAGIDLTRGELGTLRRCRVLMGRLDAETLAIPTSLLAREPQRRETIQGLVALMRAGRLQLRTAGLDIWLPDFSIFSQNSEKTAAVMLLGAHYFERPYERSGAALTTVITNADAVGHAGARFHELWERAYDVESVVREALEKLLDANCPR